MVTLQICSGGFRLLSVMLLLVLQSGSSLDACGKVAPMLVGAPVLKHCRDKASIVPSLAGQCAAAYV